MPYGAEVEEVLCVAIGARGQLRLPRPGNDPVHGRAAPAAARRASSAVQALRGEAVWKAMAAGSWAAGGWDPRLFEACLCRSQTLAQPPTFSHRYPTAEQMREWVKDPVAYRFEYADGLKATMLLMNGLVGDFTFAARLKGRGRAALDAVLPAAQPERRLLGGADVEGRGDVPDRQGAVPDRADAADDAAWSRPGCSRWPTARRLETPHLAIRYTCRGESTVLAELTPRRFFLRIRYRAVLRDHFDRSRFAAEG